MFLSPCCSSSSRSMEKISHPRLIKYFALLLSVSRLQSLFFLTIVASSTLAPKQENPVRIPHDNDRVANFKTTPPDGYLFRSLLSGPNFGPNFKLDFGHAHHNFLSFSAARVSPPSKNGGRCGAFATQRTIAAKPRESTELVSLLYRAGRATSRRSSFRRIVAFVLFSRALSLVPSR